MDSRAKLGAVFDTDYQRAAGQRAEVDADNQGPFMISSHIHSSWRLVRGVRGPSRDVATQPATCPKMRDNVSVNISGKASILAE